MSGIQNFGNDVGAVNFNFDTVPDLQIKALLGIIKLQELPEENILRELISTVPVEGMLFKGLIDDGIDLRQTSEVDMNADDPMIGDSWKWISGQIHSYRQAAKVNIELGEMLVSPEDAKRIAGKSMLERLMKGILKSIDNRREYNRAMAIANPFAFNPARQTALETINKVTISDNADKWDNPAKDVQGNQIVNPFNQIATAANKYAMIAGTYPTELVIPADVWNALETHDLAPKEIKPATKPNSRGVVKGLNVYVTLGRKNVGTETAPVLAPMIQDQAIICRLDEDTIKELQYGINRFEAFTTSDRLFYYTRYLHKSKVHIERSMNFYIINNVLLNAYTFSNIDSLLK